MDNDKVSQKLERLERNLKIIQALDDTSAKIKRLINMAQQFKLVDRHEKAQEIYHQALELTQNFSDSYDKVYLLKKLGLLQEATLINHKLLNNRLNQNLPDGSEKIDILKQLGRFQEATEITQRLTNGYTKAATLIEIANLIQESDQKNHLWQEAFLVAEKIKNLEERDRTLVHLVNKKLERKLVRSHELLPEKLLDDSRVIPCRYEKISEEQYKQALQIALRIEQIEHRNTALYDLARSRSDNSDWGIDIINQYYIVTPQDFSHKQVQRMQFKKRWYSDTLAAFEEPPLSNWADREKIQTAYRFIYIPSFHPSLVIRVWGDILSTPCLQAVTKVGSKVGSEEPCMLTEAKSLDLLTAINENKFWPSITWDLSMGCDGSTWVFEGWNQGKYKWLDAWSPDNGPAYRLGKVFFSLFPENLLELTRIY
jgi:tetratricopeptide (TPR) repeat protein